MSHSLEKAFVALLTSRLAASLTSDNFCIEGDALLVASAINNPFTFSFWSFAKCMILVLFYPYFLVGMLQKCLDVPTFHLVF